jgi:hypothetical protein
LKNSRENLEALDGDSCGGEADVLASYASPLHRDRDSSSMRNFEALAVRVSLPALDCRIL